MPRARVLVTLTEEAVVDVPADVDVESYLRERLTLEWGDVFVSRILAEPSLSVEWTPVPEAAAGEVASPAEETEEGPLVDAASTFGSVLGSVAAFVGGIKDSLIGRGDEPRADAAAEGVAEAPVVEGAVAAAADAAQASSDTETVAAPAGALLADGDGLLTREELLALFTDPLYSEMVRAAVRERAERVLEPLVGDVVEELEPLLRHHVERHGA